MKIGKNQYVIVPNGMESGFLYEKSLEFGHYNVLLGEQCHSTIVCIQNLKLLLLGYALDAQNQRDNEEKMLIRFANRLTEKKNNICDITLYWGGRWVLFILSGNNVTAMTDCCGLKQLFYADNIFGSQSRYVAFATNSEIDEEAKHYIQCAKTVDKEYAWPLHGTGYNGVKRLLPNHLYSNGEIIRINPSEHFLEMKEADRANAAYALLKDLVQAASYRANLAVTLTAGWDSRLVLAASKGVKDKIDVVTLKYHQISENHIDIVIPKMLCEEYEFKHKVLICEPLESKFVEKYKEHSENAHDYWMQMAQSTYRNGYKDWLWTKGSCNEISRNSSGVLYDWQINVRILSSLYSIYPNEYSKNIITQWIDAAKDYSEKTNFSLLDIFYWEHRLGSWLAECLNEADVVGETFTPFNVRAYFEIIKNVPVSKRVSPHYVFFQDMLTTSGMSLNIPINPHRYDSIKAKIKCLLKNKFHLLYGIVLNR